ncbi:MAG: hypothetical protein EBZ69_00110 [Alphaproteobacteria bacterium]|nr:hypothetical protein [Alphaproteobacteria bacterium]
MSVIQADFVGDHPAAANQRYEITETLTEDLQGVISEIDQIFGDVQVASLTAFWRVGRIITDVRNNPEIYLTQEQINNNIDGASLLISIFAPVYTADQLRSAVSFFEKYPSEGEVTRLLNLRCPERPRWRMTVSHVQLLAQVPDDDQRTVLEDKCAEDGYTARNLALELQELRGKQKNGGRTHRAPKGLKQQVLDLLQHQRRFIARSEKLWLVEDDTDIYDDIANAPPEKLDTTILAYFAEMRDNFTRMSDIVAEHVSRCAKVQEEVIDQLSQDDSTEDEEETTNTPRRRQSDITR